MKKLSKTIITLLCLMSIGAGQAWGDNTHIIAVAADNSNNYTVKVEANIGDNGTKWMYEFTKASTLTFEGKKLYVGSFNEKYGGVDNLDIHLYSGITWKEKKTPYSSWTSSIADNQVFNYDNNSWYSKLTMSQSHVYFDASNWSQTAIKMVIGHANYQGYYDMTHIEGTNLYYTNSSYSWTDAMGVGVVGNTTTTTGNHYLNDISANATEFTGLRNYGINNNGANTYYLIVNKGYSGQKPDIEYNSNYSTLNSTQTIKSYIKTTGSASYSQANSKAPIAITTYKLTTQGTTTLQNASLSTSANSQTISACRTATTTLTIGEIAAGYKFDGWYDDSGNLLSNSTTYTYYPTAATTIRAYFKQTETYAVTIQFLDEAGNTVAASTTVNVGKEVADKTTVQADDHYGFNFKTWELATGVTKQSGNLTDKSITLTASAATTIIARYTEITSTGWYLRGTLNHQNGSDAGWTSSGQQEFIKNTGETALKVGYVSLNIDHTQWAGATAGSYIMELKLYDGTNLFGSDQSYTKDNNGTAKSLWQDNSSSLKLSVTLSGTYTFKIDYSGTYPTLSVAYPIVNQLQIYSSDPTDDTNTQYWSWDSQDGTTYTKTLTLNADSKYTLKPVINSVFYGGSNISIKRTNADNNASTSTIALTADVGDNITLYTYYGGSHTFTFNSSTRILKVTYPDLPAMTGTFEFPVSQTGKISGTGTSDNPYLVFQGETMTITATHKSKPDDTHIRYQFTDNGTAKTATETPSYTPSTTSSGDKRTITIKAFYEYGYTGQKINTSSTSGKYQTSGNAYYQVLPRPTVSLSTLPIEMPAATTFNASITTTNTSVPSLSPYPPQFVLQYSKRIGSSWGEWTNHGSTQQSTEISTNSPNGVGFYRWRILMYYGGTTTATSKIFYSTEQQNVVYTTYQVNITTNEHAKGWFKGVYAFRNTNTDLVPYSQNATYPGQTTEGGCSQIDDNTWLYELKYPIYTHVILNDNSANAANKTGDIEINSNTCIELTGQNFQDNANWAYSKTNCTKYYFRVKSTYTGGATTQTYYSNVVADGKEAELSFYAAATGNGTLTWQKFIDQNKWEDQAILTSPAVGGIYKATYNGNLGIKNNSIEAYTEPLYIRCDMANGGWNNYINDDNKLTNIINPNDYDYYWVRYSGNVERNGSKIGDGGLVNTDAIIGNRINKSLTHYIQDRSNITDANGNVKGKNVRYSYNSETNYFGLAVIGASTDNGYVFLSIYGADGYGKGGTSTKVFKINKSGITKTKGTATKENDATNQIKFQDVSNWIYQADLWIEADGSTNTTIAIEARLPQDENATVQQIVDRAKPLEALGSGTTRGSYIVRVLYDYKTNTIITGWLPTDGQDISETTTIEGNMILNRQENNSVEQFHIADGKEINGLKKMYLALEMQKSEYTQGENLGDGSYLHYYWISLPYDCRVSDIMGAKGDYTYTWEIWYYDGEKRAKEGLLDDANFFITVPYNGTLEKDKGYVLGVVMKASDFMTVKIDGVDVSSNYLYFPSETDGYTLRNDPTKQLIVPAHYDEDFFTRRPDRENEDRDWNLMGIPSYTNLSSTTATGKPDGVTYHHEADGAPAFYYDYKYGGVQADAGSSENNRYKYVTMANSDYKAFFSYMVQYAGTITWTSDNIKQQSPIIARPLRAGLKPFDEATLNLQLLYQDRLHDNTFVRLTDKATTDFDPNLDLSKIWNSRVSQLATVVGTTEVAGNCLPVDSQVIDIHLYAENTGTYTLQLEDHALPDGLVAILEDTEEDRLTDLRYDNYLVDLNAGSHDSRFRLHLIVGKTDIGTSIDTETLSYSILGDQLIVNSLREPLPLQLLDPTGKLIYQGTLSQGETLTLPDTRGVYILNTTKQSFKIVR